jgi:iron complex outermembrane recepter protein
MRTIFVHNPRILIQSFIVSTCVALFPVTATSQVLEEIIVTAQKREQSLQDVGISVTAFSGDQLRELGLTSTQQLHEQVPGLMVTGFGGGATTVFTIRGSGQLDFGDQQESPVALYLDGVYNSYIAGAGFNFFDLERIEVLRGSQGTLFGRNATGGLVHLVTAKPTREFEGYGEFTAGEYEKIRFEGAAGGPLSDSLAGRLSIAYENDDSYMTDLGPNDAGLDVNNFSTRAQLLFEPNEDVSVLVAMRYSTDDTNGDSVSSRPLVTDLTGVSGLPGQGEVLFSSGQQHVDWCNNEGGPIFGLFVAPVVGGVNCMGYVEPDDDPYTITTDTQGFFKRDTTGITATVDWDLGWGTLTSITDWVDFNKDLTEDADGTPLLLFNSSQNMDSNQFSQELRFAGETESSRWVVGAYYLNIDSTVVGEVDFSASFGPIRDGESYLETTTYAFFGQGEYDFNENLTVIAGLRWTEDRKRFAAENRLCAPAFFIPCPGNTFFSSLILGGLIGGDGAPSTKLSDGDWSGNIELNWRPNDDMLVYGKVSRGYKAGGFNTALPGLYVTSELTYGSETPITYEGGLKSSLFGGSTRLNASVFYTDYQDFQTFTQDGLSLLVFNIDAEVVGAEIELVTNPWEGWEFLFGVSLLDAEQQDLAGFDGIRNRPMPNAADLSLNGVGRYEWPMFDGNMSVQLDFNYVDERSLNAIDHQSLVVDSQIVANAKIGYTTNDGHWHAEVWVRNLTDELYYHSIFDTSTVHGSSEDILAAPRWFGGTVRYTW